MASNAKSGAQRKQRILYKKPHSWQMKRALHAQKFFVEKEIQLAVYLYLNKSPLLRLGWLEGKMKTKMTFEFKVFETYQ